jgi:hypothetical protein
MSAQGFIRSLPNSSSTEFSGGGLDGRNGRNKLFLQQIALPAHARCLPVPDPPGRRGMARPGWRLECDAAQVVSFS